MTAPRKFARFTFLGLCIAFAFVESSVAATPQPPPAICIDGGSCVQTNSVASNAGGKIKWHPGVYIWGMGAGNGCTDADRARDFALLDSISADTEIKGIQVVVWWNCLEGSARGDYSAGFAFVDAYLQKLATLKVPKRLMLKLENEQYMNRGDACTSDGTRVPAYLVNQGLVVSCVDTSKFSVAIWNTAGMDALIALSNAYASRYNDHPLFEMFTPIEQSALAVPASTGITAANLSTQLARFAAAAQKAWTKTQIRIPVNYIGSDSDMRGLIESTKGPGIAFGGPDTYPEPWRMITSNPVWRGLNSGLTDNTSWSDLRGQYAWVAEVESPELGAMFGGPSGSWTLQQIQDYAHDTMHNNYVIWYTNTWYGPLANQWASQLEFIRSGKSRVYSTTCPAAYTAGCNPG